jgi:hypothetical protein
MGGCCSRNRAIWYRNGIDLVAEGLGEAREGAEARRNAKGKEEWEVRRRRGNYHEDTKARRPTRIIGSDRK